MTNESANALKWHPSYSLPRSLCWRVTLEDDRYERYSVFVEAATLDEAVAAGVAWAKTYISRDGTPIDLVEAIRMGLLIVHKTAAPQQKYDETSAPIVNQAVDEIVDFVTKEWK